MGGDHHHHHEPYTVPDYRIYKVENAPKLLQIQKALAARGLKDPWLRNEVWRYDKKHFIDEGKAWRLLFFRGFKYGFGAFVLTVLGTELYNRAYPDEHGHHGHH